MKIRMSVQMSGSRNGQPWPARGEVTELPTAEAAHLVASGIAEQVPEPAQVETATAPPAETAQTPPAEQPAKPAAEKGRNRTTRKPPAAGGTTAGE